MIILSFPQMMRDYNYESFSKLNKQVNKNILLCWLINSP